MEKEEKIILVVVIAVVAIIAYLFIVKRREKNEDNSILLGLQSAKDELSKAASANADAAKTIAEIDGTTSKQRFLTKDVVANNGETILLKAGSKIKVYKSNDTGSKYKTASASEGNLQLGTLKKETGSWYRLKNSSFVSYRDAYHWIKRSDFEGKGILYVNR